MTADQFQREVVDILGLSDKTPEECLKIATWYNDRAISQTKVPLMCACIAIMLTALTQGCGYSLETIFQMALDGLEAQKKDEQSV